MTGVLLILAVTFVIVICTLIVARRDARGSGRASGPYLESPSWSGSMAGGPATTDLTAPAISSATLPDGARLRSAAGDAAPGENDNLVDEVVRGLQRIPPLPHVLFRVLSEIEHADSSARSLAGIVATEPVLTASLLRVANSAANGLVHKVITADEAVAYLGYSTVRSFVLRMKLAELMPQRAGASGYNSEHLWLHSLVVGQVAAHLAKRVSGVDVGLVSTIGLLHDIGKLAINSQFPDTVAQLFAPRRRAGDGPADESFLARERRLFGADHAFIGAFLAAQWKLPPELTDAIRLHHLPDEHAVGRLAPGLRRATQLVHVANQLAKYAHVYCADMEIDIVPEALLLDLGLPADLEALLTDELRAVIRRAADASHHAAPSAA